MRRENEHRIQPKIQEKCYPDSDRLSDQRRHRGEGGQKDCHRHIQHKADNRKCQKFCEPAGSEFLIEDERRRQSIVDDGGAEKADHGSSRDRHKPRTQDCERAKVDDSRRSAGHPVPKQLGKRPRQVH
jgi:hypothetical protein